MSTDEYQLAFLLSSEATDGFGDDTSFLRLNVRPVKLMTDGSVRNFIDTWPREPLADLVITAQVDSGSEQGSPYGHRVEYLQPYNVNLERAESMVKTLRKITRGLERLQNDLGYAESFGAYVARVGKVLAVKAYGRRSESGELYANGTAYQWSDAAGMAGYIDSAISEWRKGKAHA